jgi:malate dehydrogenase (oxaloacetate-decarboxylating)(NADP+)
LPKGALAAGGLVRWNAQVHHNELTAMVRAMVTAKTKEEALNQVNAMIALDHHLWAYLYMRMLIDKDLDLAFSTILYQPAVLLPIMYTPTVGEACQKFGMLPLFARGCYVCIEDAGNIKAVLQEYADTQLPKGKDGKPLCDCIVFSDGGRILGLGDLGAHGMGIPIGKLDLYTACGGFNPHRTIPLIIDAGCGGPSENTAHLDIRDSPSYIGLKKDRIKHRSEAGTLVNSAYYGPASVIKELMTAAADLFGPRCLLQFEDFNSNDAFPLLEEYRTQYLTYNDDIQGTAAIAIAGILGAIKLKHPQEKALIDALRRETFLFHGAGSANLGAASLLIKEGKVPRSQVFITNSRGVIWKSEDGQDGNFRNEEQKEFAYAGKPSFDSKSLESIIANLRPSCVLGAAGVTPNCFTKEVIETLLTANLDDDSQNRPIIFAMSNPKSQAECTAEAAYTFSKGHAIFGGGTYFEPVEHEGRTYAPGQVNNVYIFPGVSFGACVCAAKTIPDRFFLIAAQAVANSLTDEDLQLDRVIPARERLREVSLEVATAFVLEAQKMGLATRTLGADESQVKAAVKALMWEPGMPATFGIPE